ncbi:YhcH/YjgK/YiaL family protein [Prevotella ihumii]|uniref:YhcH/YjgK/YiaL family protein n=1 Tax=Prevotella ihumii TaxID=1917878 RepID=UPI000981875D|nr:YhcH/YjgK/YiaL family protein [Prevotella ihumii]
MVIGNLDDAMRYYALHPRMREVFEYVAQHQFDEEESGRIELDGAKLFINLDEVELEEKEARKIEFHKAYIDVQIPLSQEEVFGWSSLSTLGMPDIAYDEGKDVGFYCQEAEKYISVKPQQFIVFFPEDGHAPLIGKGKQRKLIAKIKIEQD